MRARLVLGLWAVVLCCAHAWGAEREVLVAVVAGPEAPSAVVVQGSGTFHSGSAKGAFAGRLEVVRNGGELVVSAPGQLPTRVGPRLEVRAAGAEDPLAVSGRPSGRRVTIDAESPRGLRVVAALGIEQYLLGCLPHKVFVAAGDEAAKAQAVALRTRLLHELDGYDRSPTWKHRSDGYHFCARAECCRAYGTLPPFPKLAAAVERTRGEVLVRSGRPIFACSDSNAGGRTEDLEAAWPGSRPSDHPYLQSVESPLDEAGARVARGYEDSWLWERRAVPAEDVRQRVRSRFRVDLGPVQRLEVRSRTNSGRVRELVVEGERSSRLVVGSDLVRAILGTPSALLADQVTELTPTGGVFRISGRGSGSGVGLSHHGALGMARAGDRHCEILGHYYPGVDLAQDYGQGPARPLSAGGSRSAGGAGAPLGGPPIRVGLWYGASAPKAAAVSGRGIWRGERGESAFAGEVMVEAEADGIALIAGGTRTMAGASVTFAPERAEFPLALAVGAATPEGRPYRGVLSFEWVSGKLTIVNTLGFEDYLRGVVSNETFSLGGAEVFKVQAVVSRTFALYQWKRALQHPPGVDICATGLHCQEYRGQASETGWGDEGVRETSGEVPTWQGDLACAFYHDNAGGHTETPNAAGWTAHDGAFPYLRAVPSPWDEAGLLLNRFEWCYAWNPEADSAVSADYPDRTVIDPSRVRERLKERSNADVGEIADLIIRERSDSGRVTALEVRGERGTVIVSGSDRVRAVLGAPSSLITSIDRIDGRLWVSGMGRAHGVGLSQHGALGMALECYRYDQILGHYYAGVELTPKYGQGGVGSRPCIGPELSERRADAG